MVATATVTKNLAYGAGSERFIRLVRDMLGRGCAKQLPRHTKSKSVLGDRDACCDRHSVYARQQPRGTRHVVFVTWEGSGQHAFLVLQPLELKKALNAQ